MSTLAASLSPRALSRRSDIGGRGLLSSVVEEIGLRVVNGTYEVGATIPIEPELMAELDVSRTVLREALKILIAKGLLESRPKIGTRVLPRRDWNMLDPTILRLYCQVEDYSNFSGHFQQLRAMIEPEAAQLAASRRTPEQLATIEAAYTAMAQALTVRAWTDADLAFHQAILEATGNPFVVPLGSLIHTALETLLYQSASNAADPFESIEVHRHVLDAIRNRDSDAAGTAMKRLLGNTSLAVSHAIDAGRFPSALNPSEKP